MDIDRILIHVLFQPHALLTCQELCTVNVLIDGLPKDKFKHVQVVQTSSPLLLSNCTLQQSNMARGIPHFQYILLWNNNFILGHCHNGFLGVDKNSFYLFVNLFLEILRQSLPPLILPRSRLAHRSPCHPVDSAHMVAKFGIPLLVGAFNRSQNNMNVNGDHRVSRKW